MSVRRRSENIYSLTRERKFKPLVLHGVAQYRAQIAMEDAPALYTEAELNAVEKAGVSTRLLPRPTNYCLDFARRALRNPIEARAEETKDLAGEGDLSNQLEYSPVFGLFHKHGG